jgi:hypothetical protein
MTRLLNRQVIVQLDNRSYEGLRVDFDVTKTIGGKPNKARIEVYNLDELPDLQNRDLRVRLVAGYDTPALIFQGNPVKGGLTRERSGGDLILKIEAQDGIREYQNARVNVSFSTATSFQQVVDEVSKQMGLPQGTIRLDNDVSLTQGFAYNGAARDVLDRIATSVDADWSIQDGQLQLLPYTATTPNRGPLYSTELRNLIDAKPTDDGVEVVTFLDSAMKPGDRFKVESDDIDGVFKANRVNHAGSKWQNDFYTTIEAKPSPTQ